MSGRDCVVCWKEGKGGQSKVTDKTTRVRREFQSVQRRRLGRLYACQLLTTRDVIICCDNTVLCVYSDNMFVSVIIISFAVGTVVT